MEQTEWYKRIRSTLKNPLVLICMIYAMHVAQKSKLFIIPMQAEEPKVLVFYSKYTKLLKGLMTKFFPTDSFMNDPELGGKLLQKKNLWNLSSLKKTKRFSFTI